MPLSTIALVIGISYYQDASIEELPAAKSDAIVFARALKNWGLPASNILLFLDNEASFAEINATIEQLAQKETPFKFLFYFCGHGFRTPPPLPHSYLLFHDSHMGENPCKNSMTLDFLIHSLIKCTCTEFYIFIDACHLRINTIVHPNLKMETDGMAPLSKSFFCLLSSGIEASFEDALGEYGYFTDSLLRGLATIRLQGGSPDWLISFIRNSMEKKDLPLPEMYNIGTQKIDFFHSETLTSRSKISADFQDFLIQNREQVIGIVGEQGLGKTTFCKLLASNKYKVSLLSFPALTDEQDALCAALVSKFGLSTQSDYSLEDIFKAISEKQPYQLILIDHYQFKSAKQFNRILKPLSQLPIQVVFTTRHSLKPLIEAKLQEFFCEWELPALHYREAKELIFTTQPQMSEKDCEIIFLASRGNPLKIQKGLLQHPLEGVTNWEKEEIKKTIHAIYSCGLYFNEDLFCTVFDLNLATLRILEEIGLIFHSKDCWIPHEFLHEIAESIPVENNLKIALEYWYQQTDELPKHPEAAKSLILILTCLGYEQRSELYLERAFQVLFKEGKENLPYFMDGVDIFLKKKVLTKSSLYVADTLLFFGKWELAQKILEISTDNPALSTQTKVSYLQCLWKSGNYLAAIDLASQLIKKKIDPSLAFQCLFHRGICHFLLGHWKEAELEFSYLIKKTTDLLFLGYAKCMLGTVLGLRGLDVFRGKELLQAGIHLLLQCTDQTAVWLGWNNLGEILWKIGDYRLSAFHLQKAFDIGMHCKNPNMQIESIRNLLQLHWRLNGPFCREVNEMLTLSEAIDLSTVEHFAKMQFLNTTATIYLMRGEEYRVAKLLKQVIPLTIYNHEYHIYTLSNLAIFFKIRGEKEKGRLYLQRAIDQAKLLGNNLALQQIEYDFAFCNS